jgi:hypothetical protein
MEVSIEVEVLVCLYFIVIESEAWQIYVLAFPSSWYSGWKTFLSFYLLWVFSKFQRIL